MSDASVEDRIKSPADHYASPDEVLADASLTGDEKLRLLHNWQDEVRHRLGSEAENMPAVEHHAEEDLLQAITEAILLLERC